MTKNFVSLHISGTVPHYDFGFWYTCVKWWYLQQFFFHFFRFWFLGFSKFTSKCQKEILRCAPPSSHVCHFLFMAKTWYNLKTVPEKLCLKNSWLLCNCKDVHQKKWYASFGLVIEVDISTNEMKHQPER